MSSSFKTLTLLAVSSNIARLVNQKLSPKAESDAVFVLVALEKVCRTTTNVVIISIGTPVAASSNITTVDPSWLLALFSAFGGCS